MTFDGQSTTYLSTPEYNSVSTLQAYADGGEDHFLLNATTDVQFSFGNDGNYADNQGTVVLDLSRNMDLISIPPPYSLSPRTNRLAPSWASSTPPIRRGMRSLIIWSAGKGTETIPSLPSMPTEACPPRWFLTTRPTPRLIPSGCRQRTSTTPP